MGLLLFEKSSKAMFGLILVFATLFSLHADSSAMPSLTLTQRQLCDLELLMNGGFAPLETFMDKKNYDRVLKEMRLADGTVWPMPIVLDITEAKRIEIEGAGKICLKDMQGFSLALLNVEEIWQPNKEKEAQAVYGSLDQAHPGVDYLLEQMGEYYITGKLEKISLPKHYDFVALRRTPAELKKHFKEIGATKVVAFQTRNPMHRAHFELTKRAAEETGAHLLIHPAVGMTKPGDVDYYTRVKCYQHLLNYFPDEFATLSLLPIAMRMAGPKEALWHAIIRKNYGCTHFIVGRDHAGPGKDSNGNDFYGPYDAQELVKKYQDEVGIQMVPFMEMVYIKEDQNYQPADEVTPGKTILNVSGTQFRKMLRDGSPIPDWFSLPEIIEELKKVFPPREKQGFTLFFTGLSGSGKSTLANVAALKLMELQSRPLTLLDGDVVRHYLSKELTFSKEHRSMNVQRIGYVASEITKNRGIAICALIAPYEKDRTLVKKMINDNGAFIEIYVSTPINECENRDTKGLYALAREGKVKEFTGISDPYEVPQNPDLEIDTTKYSVEEAVELILNYLRQENFF